MAHAPALLRTNTTPVFSGNNLGGISGPMNGSHSSQLSASAQYGSSSVSLSSMSMAPTPVNGGPVMATANIINQKADASRSLYQICVSLKQRLAQVPGFEGYLNELDEKALAGEDGGPVESLWKLFRTGHPLLVVYNSLQPQKQLRVGEEEGQGKEDKRSKLAIFKFVQACTKDLQIPSTSCFMITDLTGEDTTGFVKVTSVVNHVLDIADQRGLLLQVQPYPEDTHEVDAPGSQMSYRDHIIKEMVDTERKYVQDLENLHDLKKTLEQKGFIPGDIVHQIFLNIHSILDFQRRFLIRVETTNSMPQSSQQWGSPFVQYEEAFDVYQPFIANQRKAAQVAGQVFDKIQVARHPVACDFNTLDGFLLKPMQRLVKYPLLLKDLRKKSEDPDTKLDIEKGIEAAERVLSKANEAVNRDLLDEALEELVVRVDDWKNHRVDSFGRLLLHGVYPVVTGRSEQEKDYEIYLFEAILLCCKEVIPNKSKDKKDKTKSTTPKSRSKNNKLQLKGRIFMTNVTEIISFAKPGSYSVQIWWKGDPGVENFIIKFSNEESMKKWAIGLDEQRKTNAPSYLTSPDQSTTDFAWMRAVDNLENPYAQKDDSDEDDPLPPPSAPLPSGNSLAFGGAQPSTGGVMSRNASSTSLRTRSTTGESTQSLAGMARAPPPRFPLPAPPSQLSLQTQAHHAGAGSPGPRGGDSYFSPTVDSPASTRTSTTGSMHFSGQHSYTPQYKPGTPQAVWDDPSNRFTAPAMPRAPSRDGTSPVNAHSMNGRGPRGPSMPALTTQAQQALAASQRSRSYSTADIHGAQSQRKPSNASIPAVPGIPSHLNNEISRSQNGSPMQDLPIRSNTQSPGVQRERLHQAQNSYGGKMAQFPAQPIYPRQGTPSSGSVPPPIQIDNRTAVSPPLATATQGTPMFSPSADFPTQLKVKVNCDTGNYFTLVVAYNITYQTMIDRIDAKLSRFTNSSISKGNLKLRYRDEDGDFVNIESDEDVQIAFMEHRESMKNQYNVGGVGEIELFCVGETG